MILPINIVKVMEIIWFMAQAIYKIVRNIIFNCDQIIHQCKKIKKQIKDNKYNSYNLAF